MACRESRSASSPLVRRGRSGNRNRSTVSRSDEIMKYALRLFVVGCVHSAYAPAALGDTSGSPLKGTVLKELPNGMRLLVREQHSTTLVAIDVWVRAGSGKERAGESGAAHFLEHLIFKGTPTRKPG